MFSGNGHVSRSNHTNTTPPWTSSARYAGMDRRSIERSSRAYENGVNEGQERAAAARARLQEKLSQRKIVQDTDNSQLTDLLYDLYALTAGVARRTGK